MFTNSVNHYCPVKFEGRNLTPFGYAQGKPAPLLHQERGESMAFSCSSSLYGGEGRKRGVFLFLLSTWWRGEKTWLFPTPPLLMQERGLGGEVLLISNTVIGL